MKNTEIYCFSGKLGVGKNYVAEKVFLPLLPEKKTIIIALADHFKIECIVKDNLEFDKVFGEKDEYTRKRIQDRGTKEGRNVFGENIWVDILKQWIKLYESRGYERFIITDVRFRSELKALKEIGATTFRINAPKRNKARLEQEALKNDKTFDEIANHISEIDLDGVVDISLKFDYHLWNDYESDILSSITNIVTEDILPKTSNRTTIFVDLDDTLCECDKYYYEVMELCRDRIRDIVDSRNIDKVLDIFNKELIKNNDSSYFLTPFTKTKFAESLVASFDSLKEHYLFSTQIFIETKEKIYELGMSVFDYQNEELANAINTVRELNKENNVIIFTVGDRIVQTKKLIRLGLSDLPFEIFDHKDETLFRHLKSKYPSTRYIMVGDSEYRDIAPAKKCGFDRMFHINKNSEFLIEDNIYRVKSIEEVLGKLEFEEDE